MNSGRQKGLTFIGFIFTLAVIFASGLMMIRFGTVYYEQLAITSSLQSLTKEDNTIKDENDVRKLLNKRLAINEVRDLGDKAISISRSGDSYHVKVAYEKKVKLIGNYYATVAYDEAVEVSP